MIRHAGSGDASREPRFPADGTSAGDRRAWRLLRTALSASAFVFVCAGVFQLQYRQAADVYRSLQAGVGVLPTVQARLAEPPLSLGWPEQPDSAGYVVTLMDAAGEVVYSVRIPAGDACVELPPAVRLSMTRETYIWTVRVLGPAVRELGPFWFSIEADAAAQAARTDSAFASRRPSSQGRPRRLAGASDAIATV